MAAYSDKLEHEQVVINCRYSIAKMCTRKDTLAHSLGEPCLDDVMSYNSLSTSGDLKNYLGIQIMGICLLVEWFPIQMQLPR